MMASDLSVVEKICTPFGLSYRKMFGEYTVYYKTKPLALICDNIFYVKPTRAVRLLLGDSLSEASPYPGARLHFVIGCFDDKAAFQALLDATFDELPFPIPKKKKAH